MADARSYSLVLLPGDGIGPEVTDAAVAVMNAVAGAHGFSLSCETRLIGGAALDGEGVPLSDATLSACQAADAVFLGAVGGPAWDGLKGALRPEAGLLALRKGLGTFANLRPVSVPAALAERSPLRSDVVAGADLLIVRELTGGVYFGEPRAESSDDAFDTMRYRRDEVERIARVAGNWARRRSGRVTSVDKANVLASSRLWRETIKAVFANEFADLVLDHLYVDNAAMQVVRAPRQFDVVLTGNLFGDILSDLAATLPGSLGLLPSASVGTDAALFEPVHGSAPDIAGQGVANPMGAILSAAMLLEHLGESAAAADIQQGVDECLAAGVMTADLDGQSTTAHVTEAVAQFAAVKSPTSIQENQS